MPPKPDQKACLITGCTPGSIGHALALEFHVQGVHVIATARSKPVLDGLVKLGMDAIVLDVTSDESIEACRAEVESLTGGRLDILVNNAGRTHTVPCTDLTRASVVDTFQTNIIGPMLLTQALIQPLVRARGIVVNVASVAACMPYTFGSVYSASKGAMVSYSRTLRSELRALGVRVLVVMAGTVRSNIASHAWANQPLRDGSLWAPAADVYAWRQQFSQRNRPADTRDFARGVVREVMRGEGWGGGRGLVGWLGWLLGVGRGTAGWYWAGGTSSAVWWLSVLGETVSDWLAGRQLRVPEITRRLEGVGAKQD